MIITKDIYQGQLPKIPGVVIPKRGFFPLASPDLGDIPHIDKRMIIAEDNDHIAIASGRGIYPRQRVCERVNVTVWDMIILVGRNDVPGLHEYPEGLKFSGELSNAGFSAWEHAESFAMAIFHQEQDKKQKPAVGVYTLNNATVKKLCGVKDRNTIMLGVNF